MKKIFDYLRMPDEKRRRGTTGWKRVRTIVAAILVFSVTYSLILPVIAIEKNKADGEPGMDVADSGQAYACHYAVHQHTDACYEERAVLDEYGNDTGRTEKVLVCGRADYAAHMHDESCYQNGVLVCTLPEVDAHQHDEKCYETRQVLTCQLPETDGHQHTDSCYTETKELTCNIPEHVHTDACYSDVVVDTEEILTCGYEEGEVISPAIYSDPVVDDETGEVIEDAELIEEAVVHHHDSSCYRTEEKTERQLTCGMSEHSHTDNCYTVHRELTCGLEEGEGHHHTDACYEEQKYLLCDKQELHTHTMDCYEKGPNGESPEEMGWAAWAEDENGNRVVIGDPAHRICGKIELLAHQHDDACWQAAEVDASGDGAEGEIVDGGTDDEAGGEADGISDGEAAAEAADGSAEGKENWFYLDSEDADGEQEDTEENAAEEDPSVEEDDVEAEKEDSEKENDKDDAELEKKFSRTVEVGVDGAEYSLVVSYDNQSGIPENAEFMAVAVSEEQEAYEAYQEKAFSAVEENINESGSLTNRAQKMLGLFDMTIVDENGKVVEPKAPISVTVNFGEEVREKEDDGVYAVHFPGSGLKEGTQLLDAALNQKGTEGLDDAEGRDYADYQEKEDGLGNTENQDSAERHEDTEVWDSEAAYNNVQASNLAEELAAKLQKSRLFSERAKIVNADVEVLVTEEQASGEVSFEAGSFSVYAVVYTVDFHWEVNGKMYEFSIPGGSCVSFSELVEILGIARSADEKEGVERTENDDSVDGNISVSEAESLAFSDIEISDETRQFVEDINNIEFSTPELLSVSRVENTATVGEIKENLGLVCEYSSELTQEQIAQINSAVVEAGDWALISLQAFDTEEYLTVTMKTGEVFVVRVTDARDPYNISGKQFSIVNQRNGNGAWQALKNAANTQGNNDRGNYLQSTSSSGVTVAADGNEYCDIGSTVWKFEYVETDESGDNYYRISCNGKYLSIDPTLSSKTETPRKSEGGNQHPNALSLVDSKGDGSVNDGTRLKVVKNADGTFIIQNANGLSLWNYGSTFWLSNPTNPLDNEANDSNARIHLAIPENPAGEHKAEMISAGSLEDGQKIVVYQRIYQGNDAGSGDTYKYYAIDGSGNPVQVYQNGDSIYWKGNASVEWTLTELYDVEGRQTGYYTLYNETTGTYLTPKNETGSNGSQIVHKLSDFDGDEKNLSISLPGVTNNEYVSSIACWDYTANVTYGVSIVDNPSLSISTPELLRSQPFYFASREPVVQKALTQVETVDSASKGISITMYDFHGEEENTYPSSNNPNYIPARLKFMDAIMGNELWTQGAYDPYFVTRYLEDSKDYPKIAANPSGKRYWSNGSVVGNSLRDLFENTGTYNGKPQVTKTEDVNHLFIKSVYDATGYFHYSCFENAAYLNGTDFEVYDQLATGTDTNNYAKRGNFWPYDEPDTSRTPTSNQYDTDLNAYGNNSAFPRANEDVYYVNEGKAPNYYFGMIMEAKFNQNQDGVSDHGDPMIFEFNGDDDLWIYIDEVLVLDIGGVHDAFRGKINFQTGLVQVFGPQTSGSRAGETTYIKEQYWQAHKFPDGSDWLVRDDSRADIFFTNDGEDTANRNAQGQPKLKGTYKDFTTHNFKMFYMERGAGASQLEMTFNLPVLTGSQFRVKKEMNKTQSGEDIQNSYADGAFYYEAYVKDNGEFKKVTRKYLAEHGLDVPVYDDEEHTEVIWKSDDLNETKFELKPGYTAIFPAVDDTIEWYVVEVEPEEESHMLENYAISNSDPESSPDAGVQEGAQSAKKTIKVRNIVTYDNKPDDKLVNELQIKKQIIGNAYNEDDSFEYRIFLETTAGELVAYSLGEYYQTDAEGRYVYFMDGQRHVQSENPNGPYTYTYMSDTGERITVTDSPTPRYAEHTSVNGSIANIQDGDTIIVRGLLEGTDFLVYERTDYDYMTKDDTTIPGKYTFIGTETEDAYTRIPETNRPNYPFGHLYDEPGMDGVYKYSPSEYELIHAARGAIIQEKDAKVLVKNNGDLSFDIKVKKNWPQTSDVFSMDDLTNDSKVIFTLGRYKLDTRHGTVTLNGTISVKSGDTMPETTADQVNPKYMFVKGGKICKTVEYSEMTDGSITITDLPVGTYLVYCYDDVADFEMASSSGETTGSGISTPVATINIKENTPAQLTINSEYARQRGKLIIAKHLSGEYGDAGNVSLTYTVKEGDAVVATETMTYDQFTDGTKMVEITDLPTGIYTVTERVDTQGDQGEHTPGSQIVHVTKTGEVWATFVGNYPEKKIPVQIHSGRSGSATNFGHEVNVYPYNNQYRAGDRIRVTFKVKDTNYYSGNYYYGTSSNNLNGIVNSRENSDNTTLRERSVEFDIPTNAERFDIYITSPCGTDDWAPTVSGDPSVVSAVSLNAASPRRLNAPRMLGNSGLLRASDVTYTDVEQITQSVTPESDLPELTDEQAVNKKYVIDDDWSMTVEMTKSGYTLKKDGETVSTGTITSGENFWDAVLKNGNIITQDINGDVYYYYISAFSEENVPDGMVPSFDLDTGDDAGKVLVTGDGHTRVLSVTNNLRTFETAIEIIKVKKDDKEHALTGATFKLTRVQDDSNDNMEGTEEYTSGNQSVDEDGRVIFDGLKPGRYRLEEVESPTGYVLVESPWYFIIDSSGAASTDKTAEYTLVSEADTPNSFYIENEPGAVLPNAGGPGTTALYLAGLLLMALAGAGVVLRKRRY